MEGCHSSLVALARVISGSRLGGNDGGPRLFTGGLSRAALVRIAYRLCTRQVHSFGVSQAHSHGVFGFFYKGDRRPQLGYCALVGRIKATNDPLRMGLGKKPKSGEMKRGTGAC
jgi:hypothetical protein